MSIHVLSWVFNRAPEDLNASEMLVALVLADYASDETGLAYPSVPRIMKKSRLKERAVRYALDRLVVKGVIREEMPATQHRPKVYAFPVFRPAKSAPLDDKLRGAKYDSPGVQNMQEKPGDTNKRSVNDPSVKEQTTSVPKAGTKRRTKIPDDWSLTDKLRTYATDRGIPESRVDEFAEEFKTYWQGDGRPKADWDKTFMNRVIERADTFAAKNGRGRTSINDTIVGATNGAVRQRTPEELAAMAEAARSKREHSARQAQLRVDAVNAWIAEQASTLGLSREQTIAHHNLGPGWEDWVRIGTASKWRKEWDTYLAIAQQERQHEHVIAD